MFNSIVLDVVIGLVFIYLLYSLLVTILSELVASMLTLRARNLKAAIDRMLNDDKSHSLIRKLWDWIYIIRSPKNPVVKAFYEHPEIKYQGSSGIFKYPSNFKASSFSKTIMELIAGKACLNKDLMDSKVENDVAIVFPYDERESQTRCRTLKRINETIKFIKEQYNHLFYKKRVEQEDLAYQTSSFIINLWNELKENEKKFKSEFNQLLQSDKEKGKLKKIPIDIGEFIISLLKKSKFENRLYTSTPDFAKFFLDLWNKSKGNQKIFKLMLRNWIEPPKPGQISPETENYIRSLWQESQGDLEKFKLLLESWFEKTMVHTLEWYKLKIRLVSFVLGFILAWIFYADTFVIVNTLSTDKDARAQMVNIASTYVQNNKDIQKSEKLDSLLAIQKHLQEDITKANNILGLGGWPPDTLEVNIDSKTKARSFTPLIDVKSLPPAVKASLDLLAKEETNKPEKSNMVKVPFSARDKRCYFFQLFCHHFFGFLMTAIAISLGAPFWFDLLNKFMKFRTSTKEAIKNPDESASSATVSPLNRVG